MNEALSSIATIEAEIAVMGANDCEFSVLKNIRKQLGSGKISPGEAICRAEGLRDSKQDYH